MADEQGQFFYPNRMGRIIMRSLEALVGKPELDTILSAGGLEAYSERFPPSGLDKGFPSSTWAGSRPPWRRSTARPPGAN